MRKKRPRPTRKLRGLERLEQRLPLAAALSTESSTSFNVASLTIPVEVVPLQSALFSWRVEIAGDETLPDRWTDKLFVSQDDTLDDSDIEVASLQVRSFQVRTDSEGQRYYEPSRSVYWDFEDAYLFVVANAEETPLDDTHEAVSGVSVEIPKDHDAIIRSLNTSERLIEGRYVQYALAIENTGAGSLNRPRVSFYLSDDAIHSADDVMIGEVASRVRYTDGFLITNGAFLPADLPAAGDYFLIAEVDVPSESNSGNNEFVRQVNVRGKPLLTFDGFSGDSLNVQVPETSLEHQFEFEFFVRNDHDVRSRDGEFAAELRLNDGRSFANTDVYYVEPFRATDLDPHTSGVGRIRFSVANLPVGRHEVAFFQSGRELDNAVFDVEPLAPRQFAAVLDRSAKPSAWSPASIEVDWTVDVADPISLSHQAYWSSDPWFDSQDTLLGSEDISHGIGLRQIKAFYSAPEFAGQNGYLILRTASFSPGFSNGVLDTYTVPLSLTVEASQHGESLFVVDVSDPYPGSSPRYPGDDSVDVWVFNNADETSLDVQLIAQDPSDPNVLFELTREAIPDLARGEFGQVTLRLPDSTINVSPYVVSARLFAPGPVEQVDPPTKLVTLDRADLRIVDLEVPDLVEEGSVIRWTVENQSDVPWEGDRYDSVSFKISEDVFASRVTQTRVTEPLMPGEQVVIEATVPRYFVAFGEGFVTVELGQDLTGDGSRPNLEDDQMTAAAEFTWSRLEFELLDPMPLLEIGENELVVRLSNSGMVPTLAGQSFSLDVGNNLNIRPRVSPFFETINAGESLDVTLEFELSEFAIGADQLRISMFSLEESSETFGLEQPVGMPNLAASNLSVETLPNLDLRVRWTVTNVGDAPTIQMESDAVLVSPSSAASGDDQTIRLEPGESYEASVIVQRERLGTDQIVDLVAKTDSRFDSDPADNAIEFQIDTEFTSLGIQASEVEQSVSAPTTIPFTIVNTGDFTLDAGQHFFVSLERRWWQDNGLALDVQELEQTLELESPLPPGGAVSGSFVVEPLESLFDVQQLETVTVGLSVFTSFEDGHSAESSEVYGTAMIERSVVDLATSDLSLRLADFDNELVEATWTVTNVGDIAFEGPVVASVEARASEAIWRKFHSGTYIRNVGLDPGESVTFTETFETLFLSRFTSQLEVSVSVQGSVPNQTEGSRNNDRQTATLPIEEYFPVVQFDPSNFEVDGTGDVRFVIVNEGDLPLHERAFFRFYYSLVDHPDTRPEEIANQWIELSESVLSGQASGVLSTQLDLPESELAEFGSLYVWAESGDEQVMTAVTRSRRLSIESLVVPSWILAERQTPIQVQVRDEFEGETPWSLVAHHGKQRIELTLDRDEPVAGGDYDGTAWIRIPESLANQTLDLDFEIQFEDGSIANATSRTIQTVSPDLNLAQLEAELISGGTQLRVDWVVHGTDVQAFREDWIDSIALSADDVLDSSDIVLGSIANSNSIWMDHPDGEDAYRRTRTFALAGIDLPDDFQVIVNVDASDRLAELADGNNQLSQAVSRETPQLSIQLAASSDTGWSDRDGITRCVNPSFLVNVPHAGTLSLDFDGDDLPDVRRVYSEPGIHFLHAEEAFSEGTYEVVATLEDDDETIERSSTVIEIDTTSPSHVALDQRYTLPLAWFRMAMSDPVYTDENAYVRHRFGPPPYRFLPLELVTPQDEFVVSIPDGVNYRPLFELFGVFDIAGNSLDVTEYRTPISSNRACPFTNPDRFADANGDGSVTARDALFGINLLETANLAGVHRYPQGFADVNCSGSFSPLDPLVVINELARQASAGGEGESVRSMLIESTRSLNWMPSSKHETAFRLDDRFEPINMSEPPSVQGVVLPKQSLPTSSFEGNVKAVEPYSQQGNAETLKDLALADWCDELE